MNDFDPPSVGSLMRDQATDRLGVYQSGGGSFAVLRPVGGGKAWAAHPADLRQEISQHPRPADVEQLRSAYRLHLDECETCALDEAVCDLGRTLGLTCQEAARAVESTSGRLTAGVLVARPGEPVPPCPFPCSVCQAKGRQ
ncbi:hypothetical protein ACTWP5_16635 [Streptomyces sp. 4N509B]|uniref:hypothetical protein n=1 Tax=Streptomyces sp. 4N509B TaxID=3457413 RepID=UPI003FD57F63